MRNKAQLSNTLLVSLALAACGGPDDAIGVAQDDLLGKHEGQAECSPFTEGLIDQSSRMARIVMNSNAFAQCVSQRMNANYEGCGQDPFPTSSRATQIALAWQALWKDNHVGYHCPYTVNDGSSAAAYYQGWGEQETKYIELVDDWSESFPDWSWYSGVQPLDWRASDIVHEFMHTHDYKHPDSGCPAGYSGGTDSVPYIYGKCVYDVIDASYNACSGFDAQDTDELRLVSSWPATSACTVVSDLEHRFALRTYNGRFVRPVSAGGAGVDAVGYGHGSWETVFFIDINRGRLMSGDLVYIKTSEGHFLRASGGGVDALNASPLSSSAFTVIKVGGGEIDAGSQIQLRAYDSRYVVAEGGGGGAVNANRTSASIWETFTVEAPRRDHVIRLRAESTGRFLEVGADGKGYVNAPQSDDEDQAFWILDHNRGELRDGDLISLETLRSGHFLSTCTSGTGHVQMNADYTSACSKYTIVKLGGSPGSGIAHGDPIALRASNADYLTGIPYYPGFSYQLWNYSTGIGPWQRFIVDMVQGNRWKVR